MSLDDSSIIEHIRRRPSMYIGTPNGVFGFVHYFVDAINLVLEQNPKLLEVVFSSGGFKIRSDIGLVVYENVDGKRIPFECPAKTIGHKGALGPVVTALSEYFVYSEHDGNRQVQYSYKQGTRAKVDIETCPEEFRSEIRFAPDETIFELPPISEYNFQSF